jgi:pimeloyl-ACP methyl ester carboxylesterase
MTHQLAMRTGRKLELCDYGDSAGHPTFFFHGLIGSHYQASYISDQARERGLRIIAPNRPGVGRSEFIQRTSSLDFVCDVEDVAESLSLQRFSVIGISGGAPAALAVLYKLADRIATATIISGMGPASLPGALRGMEPRRRLFLEIGSRSVRLARHAFQKASDAFRDRPEPFLDRLISTWCIPDQKLFQRKEVYDLFMRDLHEVFTEGNGAAGLTQELRTYRHYGFSVADLPPETCISLWHGLSDTIVPPAMTWRMAQTLPRCEAHFVPGGHFVALEIAEQIISHIGRQLDHARTLNS